MILGLGSDLVDIRRIERSLERFGDRFIARLFTEEEQAAAERRSGQARACAYAKRFAAKEAGAKALGTGFAEGVSWLDLVVTNLPSGRPCLHLTGGAWRHLESLLPPGMQASIHLSLSDEYPMAQAMVILAAEPASPSGVIVKV